MQLNKLISAALPLVLGLTASGYQGPALAVEHNTWQTLINRQLPEVARCQISSQAEHHNLSLNGIGSFVMTVHEGADINYQILLDKEVFLDDIRLPARTFDRVFVFDSSTSQTLLDRIASIKTLTLVEQYPNGEQELRHDFHTKGFQAAYQDFEHCLKSLQG